MPVSHRLDVLLRALCLAGVAFAPMAAVAQDAAAPPQPASAAPPAPAVSPEAASPKALSPDATPAAAGPTPPGPTAQPEQVRVTAPKISTGVAAIVNDLVISEYDLDQRTALFLATSGVKPTKETLPQIRAQVLRSVEDEILELQEANKRKISITKAEVDKALQNLAEDNHLTVAQIVTSITSNGVTVETFRQQVAAQLSWQKLVSARYGTDILINDMQVEEAMDRLKKGADKPQFLLSEIFVAVDRPELEPADVVHGATAGPLAGHIFSLRLAHLVPLLVRQPRMMPRPIR